MVKLKIKRLLVLIVVVMFGLLFLSSNIKNISADNTYDSWNVSNDETIRNNLTEINVCDTNKMEINSNVKIFGNVVSFGPSMGSFVHYKSKDTYQNIRVRTEMSFNSTMSEWQRVVLRGNDISASSDGGTQGYFVSIEKSGFVVYRQVLSTYITIGYASYGSTVLNGSSNLYDGKYREFTFEIFDRADKTTVINIGVNGVSLCHLEDNEKVTKDFFNKDIAEKNRISYAGSGYFGFYMNATQASWNMKGKFNGEVFNANTFLGNENGYSADSTAIIENKKLTLSDGKYAVLNDEIQNASFEFTLKATNANSNDLIMSIGAFNSKSKRGNYSTLDGIYADIYKNKVEIKYGSSVLESLTGLSLLDKDVNVKVITAYVQGEYLFAIAIDNIWKDISFFDCENSSGYIGLYGFTNATITAEDKEDKNYRVLLIGNSITSHAPNASIGYGIGTDSSDSWGMATSAPEYDYSHLVVKAIREIPGYENTEFLAMNVANWETGWNSYDYVNVYQEGAAFEADLIIVKLGENAATTSPNYINYAASLNKLINFFKTNPNAKVIMTTEYWGNATYAYDNHVDMGAFKVAKENNYPIVRINDLGSKYSNINDAANDLEYYTNLGGTTKAGKSWIDEFNAWSSGVKQHPGMVGHKNIAARISEAAINLITGKDPYIYKSVEVLDDIYVDYTISELYGDVSGAYDYKKVENLSASYITDIKYEFDNNYIMYKAINLEYTGDLYRVTIPGYEDTTAGYTYKAYTVDASGSLKELQVYNTSDYLRDGVVSITGEIGHELYILIEYNLNKIFQDNTLSESKYGKVLKFANKDNENLVLDLTSLNSKDLVINNLVFPVLVSSNKDIEIKLVQGSFIIEKEVFELISQTTNNLYFSIQKLTSTNYLRNSSTVISELKGVNAPYSYINTNDSGYLTDVYEVQISYNGRSGDALYVNKGITVYINDIEVNPNILQVVTATLPSLGSTIKNVSILDDDLFYTENNKVVLKHTDFDTDIILCYKTLEEKLILSGDFKTEYTVGDNIDLSNIVLKYQHSDGTIDDVIVNEDMITGFDSSKAGEATVTIKYQGKEITFTIDVKEKTVTPVDPIDEKPTKKKGCKNSLSLTPIFILSSITSLIYISKKKKENE